MRTLIITTLLAFTSCTKVIYTDSEREITTGIVQREICLNMPAYEVAAVLGSPNIVTLDENRNEVWVYDKVSSEIQQCSKRSGFWLVIAGSGIQQCYSKRSQKTLTVIIKFDENLRVRDFNYHSSRF